MANKHFSLPYGKTGRNVDYYVQQCDTEGNPTGDWIDDADGDFRSSPADATVDTAESTDVSGLYQDDESRKTWGDGLYIAYFIDVDSGNRIIGHQRMWVYDDSEAPGPDTPLSEDRYNTLKKMISWISGKIVGA